MAGAAAATGAAGVVGAAAAATATAAAATGVAGTPGAGLLGGGAETVAAGGAAALLLASYLLMLALREAIAESISVFFVPYLSDHSLVVHVALHSVRKRSVSLMLGRVATVTATSTAAMCCAADVSVSYTTVEGHTSCMRAFEASSAFWSPCRRRRSSRKSDRCASSSGDLNGAKSGTRVYSHATSLSQQSLSPFCQVLKAGRSLREPKTSGKGRDSVTNATQEEVHTHYVQPAGELDRIHCADALVMLGAICVAVCLQARNDLLQNGSSRRDTHNYAGLALLLEGSVSRHRRIARRAGRVRRCCERASDAARSEEKKMCRITTRSTYSCCATLYVRQYK